MVENLPQPGEKLRDRFAAKLLEIALRFEKCSLHNVRGIGAHSHLGIELIMGRPVELFAIRFQQLPERSSIATLSASEQLFRRGEFHAALHRKGQELAEK